jgi:SAM-dependent methyltransferase
MRMNCQSSEKMESLDMGSAYSLELVEVNRSSRYAAAMQLPQFQVHADLENLHWWFLGRRKIFRALLHAACSPSPEKVFLDVGCGTGGNTAAFAKDYRCIGIDPIPEAVAFAKQRFPGVEFRQGYAPEDCADLMATADIVLLADVLEHIEDDFLLVSKILASMKPGGHLLMMAPADPSLWSAHDRGFEHYRRYTLPRLRMLWEGFPVEERVVSYCNSRLYPLAKIARMVARMKGSALGPNDTDLSLPFSLLNQFFAKTFAGESKRLLAVLQGRGTPYRYGVSVMALLRRTEGNIVPRAWPEGFPKDARPWMAP